MTEYDPQLVNRFTELAYRAGERCCYTNTDFLTVAEQALLLRISKRGNFAPFVLVGGYPQAERKLACFGDAQLCGYPLEPPVSCISIKPAAAKFADPLTHRDYLGSLMALGLRRPMLGDIVVLEDAACLFCLDTLAEHICSQLGQVGHTTVVCTVLAQPPQLLLQEPPPTALTLASSRLDALVAAVYRLSRGESQALIGQGKVFVEDLPQLHGDARIEPGQRISVRGFGRFVYVGEEQQTRKGRLKVQVRIY